MDVAMRHVPDMSDETVFRTRTALEAGFTPRQLRGPAVTRLTRGVYTTGVDVTSVIVRAKAALRACGPTAHLCDITALCLAGVDLPRRFEDEPSTTTHIHVSHDHCGPRRQGIRVHRSIQQLPNSTVVGLSCLNLAECWLQFAARASALELVIAGDGLMRRPVSTSGTSFLVTPQALATTVQRSHRRPGIRAARYAAGIVRPGTDSPMESVVRFHIVEADLPHPEVNYPILDDTGWPRYFLDMAYPGERIAVEYDGAVHVQNREKMQKDACRRRILEDDGWRIITVTAADLGGGMPAVLASIRRALTERA